jgi:hypothetical protein
LKRKVNRVLNGGSDDKYLFVDQGVEYPATFEPSWSLYYPKSLSSSTYESVGDLLKE